MSRTRAPCSLECRQQISELARAARRAEEPAREFEPTARSIGNSLKRAGEDDGRRQDGLTMAGIQELVRLRREIKRCSS